MLFTTASFITGFLGDLFLQSFSSQQKARWGLNSYFKTHRSLESMFIAAAMMVFFSFIYQKMDPSLSFVGISLYAIVLDLFFRFSHIMPTLDEYYNRLPWYVTFLWAILPFWMAIGLKNTFNKYKC